MRAGYMEIPREADERTTLVEFLEWQRAVLRKKCAGLSPVQMRRRAVPPSTLSLLGLVRHLTDVELGWFRRTLAGEAVGDLYLRLTAGARFAVTTMVNRAVFQGRVKGHVAST